jgi:hypothetical protein
MTANNDLQHLESTTTITLAANNTISGFRGPVSVKRAFVEHPQAFMKLLDEMTQVLRVENRKQMELEL